MARVSLTPTTILGPYPASPSAGGFDVTFTAVDEVSGNEFTLTGKEILVFHTTATVSGGVTFTSVADSDLSRTGNLTATVDSGTYVAFHAGALDGWRQTTGAFYFTGSVSGMEVGILRYA